jgi:diguanylate cyclase (GGDEF)-like protein
MIDPIALIRLEVNVLFIIFLGYVYYRNNKDYGRQMKNLIFGRLALSIMIELFLDSFCWIVDGISNNDFLRWSAIIVTIVYMINSGFIALLWCYYVSIELDRNSWKKKKINCLIFLPLLIITVASIATIWTTKSIFYIDINNVYHSGPLLFLQPVVSYFYFMISLIIVFHSIRKEKIAHRKKEKIALFIFFILPSVGGILELIFPSLPATWPAAALALTLTYVDLLGYQISTDELTGVRNRRSFDSYLNTTMLSLAQDEMLFFLLGDVDSFKSINDQYGHTEGDSALIQVASVLKSVCQPFGAFVARYGGDEFAIILCSKSRDEADEIKREINNRFRQINQLKQNPYMLRMSIGISEYHGKDSKNIEQLIQDADRLMYLEKTKAKIDDYGASKKILVVDDVALNRAIIRNILKNEYEIFDAANGKESLQLLKQNKDMCAMITDIRMSVMNGIDLIKEVRSNERYDHLAIIANTEYGDERQVAFFMNIGTDEFIFKPIDPTILKSRLISVIEKRRK